MQNSGEICFEEGSPFGILDGKGWLAKGLTGRVDENIYMTQGSEHSIAQGAYGQAIGDVSRFDDCFAAERLHLLTDRCDQFGSTAGGHDIGTVFRQAKADCLSQARRCAEDDGDLTG
jgi:hypothetical protein